ncbi:MAG: diguanylate cyclase regulator RdcB family protein [Neisseria zoodegmatis]|uniref:diguanylate cyclase regulator RdcB family protein n=1 Tax=Neisseria zoodegmatis TaxID=326523 RepID=UPI0026ECD0B0|nr:diguanylate cyclase regulator RdcB family protein [Neisseria zoodegmatis]MDO5070258.1 diguanylate cyclase regulator RdcB family protein [Neisseria zoodegmatis]
MLKISNEACVVFPYVSDKAVVDFINGLSVAGELNTIQKNRQDLVFRILDGLSGKSTMRQNHINDHLIAGLKTCRSLIYEFSQDIQKHGIALLHLNQSMTKVQNNIAFIADYVADIKENLRCMNSDLMDLRRELEEHKTLFFCRAANEPVSG